MFKRRKSLWSLVLLLTVILFLTPVRGKTADPSILSSGLTTTDRLIATGNCYYYGIHVISGASTAVVSIYDSLTISGTTIDKVNCPIATGQCYSDLPYGVEVFNGIYADTLGTGAAYTVFYRCK